VHHSNDTRCSHGSVAHENYRRQQRTQGTVRETTALRHSGKVDGNDDDDDDDDSSGNIRSDGVATAILATGAATGARTVTQRWRL
jgi:hypothetical protein